MQVEDIIAKLKEEGIEIPEEDIFSKVHNRYNCTGSVCAVLFNS